MSRQKEDNYYEDTKLYVFITLETMLFKTMKKNLIWKRRVPILRTFLGSSMRSSRAASYDAENGKHYQKVPKDLPPDSGKHDAEKAPPENEKRTDGWIRS